MKCNASFGRVASDQLFRRARNELRDAHLHACVGCRLHGVMMRVLALLPGSAATVVWV